MFLTFILSEKEIGDYFSMLFARVAVGLFFGGNIQGSLVNFCQKESPREIQMCKLVQISRQKEKEKFFLAPFYQFNLKLVN